MKKTTTRLLMLILISALILGACNLPNAQSQEDADATTVAETAAAVFTRAAETAAVASPSATVAAVETPTVTPLPTNTLFPTQGPTATKTPIPCNRATFVKDVTIPDNTAIDPGANFTKTWRLQNSGSCSWTSGYVLLFDNGDQMNAPATATITGGTVAPGSTVDISVDLTAPTTPGTYQGNFKLRSPDNIVFGINADGKGPFWVKIVVAEPTATPTATTVSGQPDLYISQIVYDPAAPVQGEEVTVKVTTYNKGTAPAGAYKVEWYPANGAPVACTWDVSGNNAGGGKVLECKYTYAGWNHAYETKAITDVTNLISESDETNNTKTQILDVSDAP